MKFIDRFLNTITMYRLVLYYLIMLLVIAGIYTYLHILPYTFISLSLSIITLLITCLITNKLFAYIFHAPTNIESVYISALILALIITPIKSIQDIPLFIWAGVISMASKYIFTVRKKHIFNPVAIAMVITTLGFNGSASWWVGTGVMLPFLLIGFLIIRKIHKETLVICFLLAAGVSIVALCIIHQNDIINALHEAIFSSSLVFFACIMLTEPLTTPPTKQLQIIYGGLIGILFTPQLHIGSIYSTPELSLVIGNIFSYLVSPKYKFILKVKKQIQTGPNSIDFLFTPPNKFTFAPGQYMEWTLPHNSPDRRGNRRYFTIASSPTENEIRLGVKFYPQSSSYKKALKHIGTNTSLVGSQLAGDFTLPQKTQKKLVFIAGGIGITPFRSMLKYLVDKNEKRDIILFYMNKTAREIIYTDVLQEAGDILGIKTIYILTDTANAPKDWNGEKGRLNEKMIISSIPDFLERAFYISGPNTLIQGIEALLLHMGVSKKHIKKDYFAGLT